MSNVVVGVNPREQHDRKIEMTVDQADEAFASLSGDKRWELVTEYMLNRIDYYESALNEAVDSGADFKLIGEKYSVHAKLKMEFVALINRVEEAAREIKRQHNPEN